jgi:heme/copper-type cytochrome/quinol oxidase subunit 3
MSQLALPSGERDLDASVSVYGVIALGVAALTTVGALTAAWVTLRYDTAVWPAKGFIIQDYYGNVLAVTLIMSGIAGWWALYGVAHDDRRQSTVALGLVIFLQGAFLNLLTYVLRSAKLSPGSSAFGALYYALNGTMIVIGISGILVAAVTLARILGGHVTSREPSQVWVAAWYTTVVMTAWLIVYMATYVFI